MQTKSEKLLVPIDFNSLSNIEESVLKLSDYYMTYGFYNENYKPRENMEVTFYDRSWGIDNSDEIMCLDAILKPEKHKLGKWTAHFNGKIYTQAKMPQRYFNPYVGAITDRLFKIKNIFLKPNFETDKLQGVSVFVFPPGTNYPNFAKVIGMNVKELSEFFMFKDVAKV